MKQRKKPIILVLFLAILFGGVAFMNKPTPSMNDQKQQQDQPQDKASDVASSVASKVSEKPKNPMAGKPHPGRPGGPGGDGPSILKVQTAPMKPKPNDSSTAGQWYTKESAKNTGN